MSVAFLLEQMSFDNYLDDLMKHQNATVANLAESIHNTYFVFE
jgi:hypothetical protein